MLIHRRGAQRGHFDHGWLQTWHSFSFGDYFDPAHVRCGPLRVLNEDIVQPGAGFPTHGHRDMEIVTYIVAGSLEHRDSMGNGSVIRPGDVQRMSAGRGVMHSEFNPSRDEPVHFLQIWLEPDRRGIDSSYQQIRIDDVSRRGRLRLIAAPEGDDGSVRIQQQARIYAGRFDGSESARHDLAGDRRGYVHVLRGSIDVNGARLGGGDAVTVEHEPYLAFSAGSGAEVLLFDLPA